MIQDYQQRCWKNYKSDIKLPHNYSYLFGNPIKVHVPVDVCVGGLMIVGAYPTAQFNTINGINDVPVADHLFPFSNDTYFDGSRIRQVKSGEELETFFLQKLNLKRSDCWITDLVKVFLFKDGHIEKYLQLSKTHQISTEGIKANRNDFMALAKASLTYLYDEIELANPKAILLLGEEVTSAVMGISKSEANRLLQSGIKKISIRDKQRTVVACPHPGILMRGGDASVKWRKIADLQLEELRKVL